MSNNNSTKEYGTHKYDATKLLTLTNSVHCSYGCGCWMGASRSGGPHGVDPFGDCPNNPKDKEPQKAEEKK